MNILFLTIGRIKSIKSRGIYTDLMRKFRDEGHNVYIVTPYERQFGLNTELKIVDDVHILGVKTLNIQKTNFIEKGVGTILLEGQFKRAINSHLSNVFFDLILYSTPPITFTSVVKMLKKRNPNAISYLLLKDIFPQNAVDLGLFSKKSPIYLFFRKKEIGLYKISDYIGCMSPANVEYVLEHNDFITADKVEVAPNSIELIDIKGSIDKISIRGKYNLPIDKPIFIYGGNLGKPQGIDFLLKCLNKNKDRDDCYFIVVGDGTEYNKLETWYNNTTPKSVSVFRQMPKSDYDMLVQSCDIGLIFLDYRFTIPNYPSRLLSYLEYKMPIIAATDSNTDIGKIAENNGYGFYCGSSDINSFNACIDKVLNSDITMMGGNGYTFLKNNYMVSNTYSIIMKHFSVTFSIFSK